MVTYELFNYKHDNRRQSPPVITLFLPPLYIIIETWPTIQIHHNLRKEALLKRITVCLLTCAFSAIMISELSSALIIKSHSQKIQINEEDIPKLGIKTLKNWFHNLFRLYLVRIGTKKGKLNSVLDVGPFGRAFMSACSPPKRRAT